MSASVATASGSNGVGRATEAVGMEFAELFDGVDDLIKRVADVENPEILRIRARVYATLAAAKSSFDDRTQRMHRAPQMNASKTMRITGANDPLDDDYPGEALGVALLVGLGLGLAVSLG
jgi:ElaB/YqjD/DUF883 family membrane-anchored ribosome-binding protein